MVQFKPKEKSFVMKVFQLIHIVNSLGIIFPKKIWTTLGVETGRHLIFRLKRRANLSKLCEKQRFLEKRPPTSGSIAFKHR